MVKPLSFITLPVVLLNVATWPATAEAGPVTAPSTLACITVQWASLAVVPEVTHTAMSPASHFCPAYVPAAITLYVSPTLWLAGRAVVVPPVPSVPLKRMASAVAILRSTAACTNAVVAICVVLVPLAAVGALGVPVNVGEASGAFALRAVCRPSTLAMVWLWLSSFTVMTPLAMVTSPPDFTPPSVVPLAAGSV